jgi:hypothetical protein
MPFLRRYNTLTVTGTTAIRIPIIKRGVVDFAVGADWTPASGDVKIAIDGEAAANITNLPTAVAMGNGAYWEFVLTAAELTCKSCVITVADSATKAVEDQCFIVETFGHASAMYPVDLSASVLPVNVTHFGGNEGTFASGIPDVKTASIAADAVNASALSANAVTEIQTGLATQSSVDAVQAAANDIQTRLPAALIGGKMDSIAELDSATLRAALGMSGADLDAQLDAILAAASAGAGTGARTVTITVDDGTTALQNAVVRLTEGVNTFRALSNASGVAVFNLDDATYTVAVTKSGYTYAGTTLVVDGTETATYSMTAVSVTPPTNPDLSAIEVLCLDEDFAAASGIDVDFRMASVAAGDQNRAHPGAKRTVTSNVSGIARFEGPQGATIEWKRGTGQVWASVTLDNDAVTNVTSLIGSP